MGGEIAFKAGDYLYECDVGMVRMIVPRDVAAEDAARALAPLLREISKRKERSDGKRECAPSLENETRICA